MKKIILLVLSAVLAFAFLPACSKKKGCTNPLSLNYDADAEEDDGSCQLAGLGGNTTIVGFPKHHGATISASPGYPDSAFVKFNTSNYPGGNASDYDAIFVADSGSSVSMTGLMPGKYFILMAGWDNTISRRVVGGIPYTLTQSSGSVNLDIPVTE